MSGWPRHARCCARRRRCWFRCEQQAARAAKCGCSAALCTACRRVSASRSLERRAHKVHAVQCRWVAGRRSTQRSAQCLSRLARAHPQAVVCRRFVERSSSSGAITLATGNSSASSGVVRVSRGDGGASAGAVEVVGHSCDRLAAQWRVEFGRWRQCHDPQRREQGQSGAVRINAHNAAGSSKSGTVSFRCRSAGGV